jgi:hypothetical protein
MSCTRHVKGVYVKKFAIAVVLGSLASVGCSKTNPLQPDSTTVPSVGIASRPATATARADTPSPAAGFGFNGTVSGFPTGSVSVSGGGTFDLASGFVKSSGGFSCLQDVRQGPLSVSINQDDAGPCLAGQGVRWDTAQLLRSTGFKCTGAATEPLKPVSTSDTTVVLQADFYRAGDANDESFTAQMIVSATDIAPGVNLWVQGVGCGKATVHFSH